MRLFAIVMIFLGSTGDFDSSGFATTCDGFLSRVGTKWGTAWRRGKRTPVSIFRVMIQPNANAGAPSDPAISRAPRRSYLHLRYSTDNKLFHGNHPSGRGGTGTSSIIQPFEQ